MAARRYTTSILSGCLSTCRTCRPATLPSRTTLAGQITRTRLGEVSSLLAMAEAIARDPAGQRPTLWSPVGPAQESIPRCGSVKASEILRTARTRRPRPADRSICIATARCMAKAPRRWSLNVADMPQARNATVLARVLGYANAFEPRRNGAPIRGAGIRAAINRRAAIGGDQRRRHRARQCAWAEHDRGRSGRSDGDSRPVGRRAGDRAQELFRQLGGRDRRLGSRRERVGAGARQIVPPTLQLSDARSRVPGARDSRRAAPRGQRQWRCC